MKSNPARVKLTYDDFLLFPDNGKRHELIDGAHCVTPSPNVRHQTILGNLYFLIRTWLEQHPVGRVFMAPLDVVFTHVDVVEPDLLFVSRHRAADILTARHVTGAPDIVVEIGSPSTRKRDEGINVGSTNDRACRSIGSSIRTSTWCGSIAIATGGSTAPSSCARTRVKC